MREQDAIAKLKRGDISGLQALVEVHQVEAVQAAFLILGSREAAKDVVQAAFLKVSQKIQQFEDGRPFRPWFLRIVANDALKAAAKSNRHVTLDDDSSSSLAGWLEDPNPGPEDLADTAESRQRVWEALQELTPKQRQSIVMRYFLDMPDKAIAKAQSRPLTSVKWSLHAGRERLRGLLAPERNAGTAQSRDESSEANVGGDS